MKFKSDLIAFTMRLRVLITLVLLGSSVRAAVHWPDVEKKPAEWWGGEVARRFCTNILSWQSVHGDWPKNTDTITEPWRGKREELKGTFDNSATTRELRFLASYFSATHDAAAREAFLKGCRHILEAQYPNGGWPQYDPAPARSYARHITFNDDAMVRLLEFLRECSNYEFVDPELRRQVRLSFEAGVDCILKCQVRVDGKLTVWCAQHDERTLKPAPARTFELISLSGAESAHIVRFLMNLDAPSPAVVSAVDAAMEWFERSKLTGIKVVQETDARSPTGRNKVVVRDASARPMWARFYEIETNRPIYSDRDGVRKFDIAEIGFERRNGYAWLSYWPEALFRIYPEWRTRRVSASNKAPASGQSSSEPAGARTP